MKRLLAIIGTVPLVVLAACGDDDDSASVTVPNATISATSIAASGSTASAANGQGATVTVVQVQGLGSVLADPNGMVLYYNDQDTDDGSVLCDKSCADEWPPLTVSGEPQAQGVSGLETADRPDGTSQVTYNGHRLYTFKEDQQQKTPTGDGASDDFDGQHFSWHAAKVDMTGSAGGSGTTPVTTQSSSGSSSAS